jgi:GDP-L-fucose synthase
VGDKRNIFVAGHRGMVGSSIKRKLEVLGHENIITRTRSELDLTNQAKVLTFFNQEAIDTVYLAAAKVGGIYANDTYPADFIYENLMIECNVIHSAHMAGVQKLLFLGSSCIYPREAEQPMREKALLTGPLEPTNQPYAVAKIAGIKLCESYNRQHGRDYRSVMPTNLYGPGDNYDLETSHVIPSLIRKMHLGKCLQLDNWYALRSDLNKRPISGVDGKASKETILEILSKHGVSTKSNIMQLFDNTSVLASGNTLPITVHLWGTGKAKREFLYVDDLASACVHFMQLPEEIYKNYTEPMLSHINVGSGYDCTIKELAETIARVVGYNGQLEFDTSKPDGAPRKLLDISRLKYLGWEAKVNLFEGLVHAYDSYQSGDFKNHA